MELILKELDNQKCTQYVKYKFEKLSYFSDRMSHDFDFNQGTFYTIIPRHVNPDYPDPAYYEFETGGRIFPFKREEGMSSQLHINYSEEVMMESIFRYLKADRSNCICLEDYSADPDFPYVKKSGMEYYLINNKIFYLIDNKLGSEEINKSFASALGFGFVCLILHLHNELSGLELNPHAEMNGNAKEKLFKSIDSFYIEVYDEESYLIWIKDVEKSQFFEILSEKVMQV
jgi:hypothetical protein